MLKKIYFLIDDHPCAAFLLQDGNLAAEVEERRKFNSLFVKSHFKQGDRLLVEESAAFTGKQLTIRLLPVLENVSGLRVEGIDFPTAVELAAPLIKIHSLYLQAYVSEHYTPKKVIQELHAFVVNYPDPNEEPPQPAMGKEFYSKLLDYFPGCLERAQSAYVEETWDMRQTYIVERLSVVCPEAECVYVVLGRRHLEGLLPFPYPYEIVG